MSLRWMLPMAIVALVSTPAMAFHCPLDAKAIDNALGKIQLDDATRAEVEALRDEGLALHNSGNHADSVQKLAQAMRILLNAM